MTNCWALVLLEEVRAEVYKVADSLFWPIPKCDVFKKNEQISCCPITAEELKAFDMVARQMLEDVQERLVYRASIYVRTDILSYNPAPGDLAYPEKLEMMQVCYSKNNRSKEIDEINSLEDIF